MAADVLIELSNVNKDYDRPGNPGIAVLREIGFQVREGEFLSLLGPSGSGKSTLLRIIAGLDAPTSGSVLYRGRPVAGVNPGCSMVFQTFALFPWLTVRENVELGLKAKGLALKERREKAERVIDMVGLDGFEGAFPRELSGGMRQRVGFARALAVDPDVLLMDEPFSALDVLTAENLRRDLLELWLSAKIPTKAIIIVTHSIEEAVYLTDHAVTLSKDPATVIADIPITLSHWRERKDPAFIRLVDQIYSTLTRRRTEQPAEATGPKRVNIPTTRAGALTGLVELLEDQERSCDLYQLGEKLILDLEDLLPIVEAAELLGFANVREGDIALTDTGRRFAQASVLERKEIFREQSLARVPHLPPMLRVLESKSNHRMPREFFLDIFERNLSPGEATKQLDTLIDWGRYAEVFAYDEGARLLYLEEEREDAPSP